MRLKAFIPQKVFSKEELGTLKVPEEALNRAYLITLVEHENMMYPSVRETMKEIVRNFSSGDTRGHCS